MYEIITSLRWGFEFVSIFRPFSFDRAIIYHYPTYYYYLQLGIFPLVYNTFSAERADYSRKHIKINTHFIVLRRPSSYSIHMCVLWVSSDCFCQRTSPIFTSRTDACFPDFLRPTLSQTILPVVIHELCLTAGFVLLCLTKSPLLSLPQSNSILPCRMEIKGNQAEKPPWICLRSMKVWT